jgi:hypothetical protein
MEGGFVGGITTCVGIAGGFVGGMGVDIPHAMPTNRTRPARIMKGERGRRFIKKSPWGIIRMTMHIG